MTEYVFSPSRGAFFPSSLMEMYQQAGTWPEDAENVDLETYKTYSKTPPKGLMLGSEDGSPAWVPVGKNNDVELSYAAERRVDAEIDSAIRSVQILSYGIDLGVGKAEDRDKITLLKKYVVELSRVSLQESYPHNINWPKPPIK